MQYMLLAVLYGALNSVANSLNADMTVAYGSWLAPLLIHAVALLAMLPLILLGKMKPTGRADWKLYMGGVVGVATTVFINTGVVTLGITLNLVLALVGQAVSSAVIDHFGLLGVRRRPFRAMKALAIGVMALGCLMMLLLSGDGVRDVSAGAMALAVILSVLSGFTVVLARMINGLLAGKCGTAYSTLMNYITGLVGCAVLFAVSGFHVAPYVPARKTDWLMYLGGPVGTIGVQLANVVTPKLPALQMSLLLFVGQIFTGMLLDTMVGKFSMGMLVGGVAVAAGMWMNQKADAKEKCA